MDLASAPRNSERDTTKTTDATKSGSRQTQFNAHDIVVQFSAQTWFSCTGIAGDMWNKLIYGPSFRT